MDWLIGKVEWQDGTLSVVQVPTPEDGDVTAAFRKSLDAFAAANGKEFKSVVQIDRAEYATLRANNALGDGAARNPLEGLTTEQKLARIGLTADDLADIVADKIEARK